MVRDITSSDIYNEAEKHIVTPDIKLISIKDPDEIRRRLDEIQSPAVRLKELFKSLFMPEACPTHEGKYIRSCFGLGFASGVVYGAILNAKSEHVRYVRKHNAAVFEGKYMGYRHVHDTLLPALAARGLKYGVRVSALTGCASTIALGSITYRNEIYLPDWIVGYAIFGGLTRLWLGSKAVGVGAFFGTIAGTFAYGIAKCFELSTGGDIVAIRRTTHAVHMAKRDAELMRNVKALEDNKMDVGVVK